MKQGFSLIEVMVALCILMICMAALSKMHLICVQSGAYGERITRATLLGNSMIQTLRNRPLYAEELKPGWHQDQQNPKTDGHSHYYRFWAVTETTEGKSVMVYVAWPEKGRPVTADIRSRQELESYACPHIGLQEFFMKTK